MSRDTITTIARSYVGTRWHHCGRLKGVGIDCAGLVICTYAELGVVLTDLGTYGDGADCFDAVVKAIAPDCILIDTSAEPLQDGDIMIFRSRVCYNHIGIYSGHGNMIHAYPTLERVVEQPISPAWFGRLARVYRVSGSVWQHSL